MTCSLRACLKMSEARAERVGRVLSLPFFMGTLILSDLGSILITPPTPSLGQVRLGL